MEPPFQLALIQHVPLVLKIQLHKDVISVCSPHAQLPVPLELLEWKLLPVELRDVWLTTVLMFLVESQKIPKKLQEIQYQSLMLEIPSMLDMLQSASEALTPTLVILQLLSKTHEEILLSSEKKCAMVKIILITIFLLWVHQLILLVLQLIEEHTFHPIPLIPSTMQMLQEFGLSESLTVMIKIVDS
jgi:hypothetical protein